MTNDNQNFINSDVNHLTAPQIAESYTTNQIKQLLKDAHAPTTQSLQAVIVTNYRAKLQEALKIQSEQTIVQSLDEEVTTLQSPQEFIGAENLIDEKISQAIDALDALHGYDSRELIESSEDADDLLELDESDIVELNAVEDFFEQYPLNTDRVTLHGMLPVCAISYVGVPKSPGSKSVNQDYTYVKDSIAIVCDGVGSGQKSDEIAKEFADRIADESNHLVSISSIEDGLVKLNSVLDQVNQSLKLKVSQDKEAYKGSGSTLAGIVRLQDGRKMIFTLGDSEVIKITNSGEILSLTNTNKDTLFGIALDSIGISDVSDVMDLDLSSFIAKLKQNFKDIDSATEDQEFLNVLSQKLQNPLFNVLKGYLKNEDTFKSGRQAIAKGALGSVQVNQENLVILK